MSGSSNLTWVLYYLSLSLKLSGFYLVSWLGGWSHEVVSLTRSIPLRWSRSKLENHQNFRRYYFHNWIWFIYLLHNLWSLQSNLDKGAWSFDIEGQVSALEACASEHWQNVKYVISWRTIRWKNRRLDWIIVNTGTSLNLFQWWLRWDKLSWHLTEQKGINDWPWYIFSLPWFNWSMCLVLVHAFHSW